MNLEKIKKAKREETDGLTFYADGTEYKGGGYIVSIDSVDIKQEDLGIEMVLGIANSFEEKMVYGVYKFPNSNKVSVDCNLILTDREKAIKIAKALGQESIYDADRKEVIQTFPKDGDWAIAPVAGIYITPGKKYKMFDVEIINGRVFFKIISNNGEEASCIGDRCFHIQKDYWKFEKNEL